jgi:hypothetical protein
MSRIFTMADDPIQYVAGMCKSLDQNGYVITYGINDSQAWYMEVKNEVIEESLVYEL